MSKDDLKREKGGCDSKISLKAVAIVQVKTMEDLNEPKHYWGKYGSGD